MHPASLQEQSSKQVPLHRNRQVMSALLGVVGFFCVWGVALTGVGVGVPRNTLVNPVGAMIVVVSPVLVLTVIYGIGGVWGAIGVVFRRSSGVAEAREAVAFYELAAAFSLGSGLLATLLGVIGMLTNLDDPRHLGPGMGLALLSQLYGVFLALVYVAVAACISRRCAGIAATEPVARHATSVAGVTAVAGTVMLLVAFGILLVSLSPGM